MVKVKNQDKNTAPEETFFYHIHVQDCILWLVAKSFIKGFTLFLFFIYMGFAIARMPLKFKISENCFQFE